MITKLTETDPMLQTIIKAAYASGETLLKFFNKPLTAKVKSVAADYVTEADLAANKTIINIVQTDLPDFNIQSEEGEFIDKKSDYTVVVDPLDGTNNFFLGIPSFCTMIGVLKNQEALFGVIYEPLVKRLVFAAKNEGAYRKTGDELITKIHVNDESEWKQSTIEFFCHYGALPEFRKEVYQTQLDLKIKRFLKVWTCAAFSWLASGKIEAVICHDLPLHDFLSGKLISTEAGARITHIGDNVDTNPNFIISNPAMHDKLVKVFKPIIEKYLE